MNEALAIQQLPRSYGTVARDLKAARETRDSFVKLAMEFLDCDARPIVIIDGMMQPRDLSVIPDELRHMMTVEALRVATLEKELHEAYCQRERFPY